MYRVEELLSDYIKEIGYDLIEFTKLLSSYQKSNKMKRREGESKRFRVEKGEEGKKGGEEEGKGEEEEKKSIINDDSKTDEVIRCIESILSFDVFSEMMKEVYTI